jgi:phage host-nuclease inhibitor protein Gam
MTETHFMDDLLAEVEEKERIQSDALCDLTLMEISDLETKIARTFATAEEEQTLIQDFALRRTSKLQERIDFLSRKLESYLRESGQKTITLPHGAIKIRKKPDRIEIDDLQTFLLHASSDMLNTVPEQVKPDITGIKSWIRMTGGKLPPGVRVVEGTESFSYKLKDNTNGTDTTDEA